MAFAEDFARGKMIIVESLLFLGFAVLLLFLFVGLGMVVEEYLAVALEVAADVFNVPHEVADASLLALGSAPEIILNFVATMGGKTDFSVGALLGSGLLAYTVIPAAGLSAWCKQNQDKNFSLELDMISVGRSAILYALSLLGFLFVCRDGRVTWQESSVLLCCFVVFLLLLCFCSPSEDGINTPPRHRHDEEEDPLLVDFHSEGEESKTDGQSRYDSTEKRDGERISLEEHDADSLLKLSADEVDRLVDLDLMAHPIVNYRPLHKMDPAGLSRLARASSWEPRIGHPSDLSSPHHHATSRLISPSSYLFHVLSTMALPYNCIFAVTIPGGRSWWALTILVAVVYVGCISLLILLVVDQLCRRAGIQHHFAGLTILALGTQIPNVFASMTMARRGYGRQITNILFGAAFPFLLSAVGGSPVLVKSEDIYFTTIALLLVLVLFVILTLGKPLQSCFGVFTMHEEAPDIDYSSHSPPSQHPHRHLSEENAQMGAAVWGVQSRRDSGKRRCSPALDKTSANTLLSVYGLILVAFILRDFITKYQI
eukprot:g79014.t1